MPRVRLKIPAWLVRGVKTPASVLQEVPVSAMDIEGVLEMMLALSEGHGPFQEILLEKTFGLILNGRYINPDDLSGGPLNEGDEVTLVPLLDAG